MRTFKFLDNGWKGFFRRIRIDQETAAALTGIWLLFYLCHKHGWDYLIMAGYGAIIALCVVGFIGLFDR